jgi:hypothetical protein
MRDMIELNSKICDLLATLAKGINEKEASSKGGYVIVGGYRITFTTEKVSKQ